MARVAGRYADAHKGDNHQQNLRDIVGKLQAGAGNIAQQNIGHGHGRHAAYAGDQHGTLKPVQSLVEPAKPPADGAQPAACPLVCGRTHARASVKICIENPARLTVVTFATVFRPCCAPLYPPKHRLRGDPVLIACYVLLKPEDHPRLFACTDFLRAPWRQSLFSRCCRPVPGTAAPATQPTATMPPQRPSGVLPLKKLKAAFRTPTRRNSSAASKNAAMAP